MKIIALNIQHGGGKRVPAIAGYLLKQSADVIVLTEFREGANSHAFRDILGTAGFCYNAMTAAAPGQNTVTLFSRWQFEPVAFNTLSPDDRRHFIMARFGNMFIAGVYFAQGNEKASLFNFFAEQNFPAQQGPIFIVGDFNTGLHYKDEESATFACAAEFEHLSRLGYHDSWRKRHPEAREFSWYSTRGNGFRIDHAFSNDAADAMITSVRYDHEPRLERYTDHAALIVEAVATESMPPAPEGRAG